MRKSMAMGLFWLLVGVDLLPDEGFEGGELADGDGVEELGVLEDSVGVADWEEGVMSVSVSAGEGIQRMKSLGVQCRRWQSFSRSARFSCLMRLLTMRVEKLVENPLERWKAKGFSMQRALKRGVKWKMSMKGVGCWGLRGQR